MGHLHRHGIGGDARDQPEQKVPEAGMALVFKLGEKIERAGACCGKHERL